LDDASDDHTLDVIKSLAQECNIERIIEKKVWVRDEPGDRNALLLAGREIGGTHFIVLDADELLTAPCIKNDFLRHKTKKLKPGQTLRLLWIDLWKGFEKHRVDHNKQGATKLFIFCDDGVSWYESDFIHTLRIPAGLGRSETLIQPTFTYGVLHFKSVNWQNIQLCQTWYKCIEHIKHPKKSIDRINRFYNSMLGRSHDKFLKANPKWFQGYEFLSPTIFEHMGDRKKIEIIKWIEQYGIDYFDELNIDCSILQ